MIRSIILHNKQHTYSIKYIMYNIPNLRPTVMHHRNAIYTKTATSISIHINYKLLRL